jgi:predicted flap endonuclease-1-like 5' DNA nuclease
MWPLCDFSLASALWLLGPLLLGILTAWWIWGGRRNEAEVAYAEPEAEPARFAAPPVAAPPVAAAPLPEPVAPEPVAPVSFSAPPVAVAPVPAAPVVAAPVAAAAIGLTAIGIPAAVGAPDDLLQIKGIGPKLNDLLISLGVRRFDQMSAWGASDVAKVDEHLGAFTGRIERDQWIEQAGLLARGAIAEFEAKFGKLES